MRTITTDGKQVEVSEAFYRQLQSLGEPQDSPPISEPVIFPPEELPNKPLPLLTPKYLAPLPSWHHLVLSFVAYSYFRVFGFLGKLQIPVIVAASAMVAIFPWMWIGVAIAAIVAVLVALLRGLFTNYERISMFVWTLFGGKVCRERYRNRMAVCEGCEFRLRQIVPNGKSHTLKSYCGQCHCPRWFCSRLDIKNWLARWQCPVRKFTETYPDDSYRDLLAAQSGCRSCGGSK
jgi:hypothetical protein